MGDTCDCFRVPDRQGASGVAAVCRRLFVGAVYLYVHPVASKDQGWALQA